MKMSATSKQIVTLIKKLLKKQKYSYLDLAEILKLKESSVKRIMSQGDFTLERIEIISEWFGLDFFEFIEKAKSIESGPYVLDSEQDKALADQPLAFYIMIQLSVGLSLKEVQKKIKKNNKEFNELLFLLDRVGLIELGASEKVKINARGPFRFVKDGLFEKRFRSQFVNKAAELLKTANKKKDQFVVHEFYMSEKNLEKMRYELKEVYNNYMKLARLEQEIIDIEKFKPVTSIIYNTNRDTWGSVLK